VLFELRDDAIEIRIAGAKGSREPVSAALGEHLAVGKHLELTGLTRRKNGFNAQALLDEGHETRDLYLVVLSRRAVNDFDLHFVLPSALQIDIGVTTAKLCQLDYNIRRERKRSSRWGVGKPNGRKSGHYGREPLV
jgi:hypothetical protein